MSECTVLELNEKLNSEQIKLIDVREYAEFSNGRVKNARHIPLRNLGKLHKELDTSEQIYLMCRTGNRSAQGQDMLKAIGFNNIINVRGGLKAWENAGFNIEKDEDAPWDIERQVRFVAGALVLFGVISGLFLHWSFVLISAFIGAGLMFAAVSNTCTMGMILLKMPWNQKTKTANR